MTERNQHDRKKGLKRILHTRQWQLLGVAVFLLVLVVLTTDRPHHVPLGEARWFLPEFRQRTSDLDKLVLWSSQGKLILEKEGNQWRLPGKDNYPADLRTVVDFILPLREMKILERKTAQPELLPLLGLDEQHGTHVVLLARKAAGDNHLLGDFVIGRASRHGHGGFVRRAQESQAWLVNKRVIAPVNAMQWIDRVLLEVPARRLQGLEVTRQGALLASLTLVDDPASATAAADNPATASSPLRATKAARQSLPAARGLHDPDAKRREAIKKALGQLVFTDVKARPEGPLLPGLSTRILTREGLVYQLQHYWQNGQWWTAVQVHPALMRPDGRSTPAAFGTEQLRRIEVANQRWQPWWYRLPANSLNALTLGLAQDAADKQSASPDRQQPQAEKSNVKSH
jgi:hypothetical protein